MNFTAVILVYLGTIVLSVVAGYYFGWTMGIVGVAVLASLSAAASMLFLEWERRLIRQLDALPPDERERKLVAMNGEQRDRARTLLKLHATERRVKANQADTHSL